MPDVVGSYPWSNPQGPNGGAKMRIGAFEVPFAPLEVMMEQDGLNWTPVGRPGRMEVLRNDAVKPRRFSATFPIISNTRSDITELIHKFTQDIAGGKEPLQIVYDATLAGCSWLCVAVTHRITHRNELHEPIGVEVSATFQEVPGYQTGAIAATAVPPARQPAPQAERLDEHSEEHGTNPHRIPVDVWNHVAGPGAGYAGEAARKYTEQVTHYRT